MASHIDGSVAVEVQDPDGNWITVSVDEDIVSGQQQIGIDDMPIPGIYIQDDPVWIDNVQASPSLRLAEPLVLSHASPDISFIGTQNLISYDQFLDNQDNDLLQIMGLPNQVSQLPEIQGDVTIQALELVDPPLSPGNLTQLPWGTLALEEGLLFERFEHELASRNPRITTQASLMQNSRLLSASPNLVAMFLTDAVGAMTFSNGKSPRENFYRASLTLRILEAVVPKTRCSHGNPSMAQLSQEAIEFELCRILLSSAANGFAGMDLPLEIVSKFLNQYSNIATLLPRLLRDKPGQVVKGLAENLFRAAVESRDLEAIRFFLQAGSIDVNNLVCQIEDKKYTLLERVAELQLLGAIRELLPFNPDVNRSFWVYPESTPLYGSDPDYRGGLGRLIEGICPGEPNKRNHDTFSEEYLDTVDSLIQAGAEVRISFILRAIRKFVRMDLAKMLVHGLAPSSHSAAISNDVLGQLVLTFTDEDAKIAFTKILSDCERTNCQQCLIRHSEMIEWAFVQGAKRGCIEFVRTHFKYVKNPAQILAAAIQSGNNELVRFILDQDPDMHAPATNITFTSEQSQVDLIYSTPLSEAIAARNGILTRELEMKGGLEHLDNGHRFHAILSAAAGVGDVEYMEKIVLLHPEFSGYDMTDALFSAVEAKREDAIRFLLNAGVEPRYQTSTMGPGRQAEFPARAYELGDKLLLCDLTSSFPDVMVDQFDDSIRESVRLGNMEIFNFFSQSGRIPKAALNMFLTNAVRNSDGIMLRHVLELGANPLGSHVFDGRVPKDLELPHIDVLRILLEHIPPTKACIAQLGTPLVIKAIENDNTNALELLISCKAIDLMSTTKRYFLSQKLLSPLGAAVTKDGESGLLDFPLSARLLDAGCDINSIAHIDCDECGRRLNKTPLLIAIETKSKPLVQFLLDRGAYVNKEAIRGIKRTPIQAAAEVGSLDIVELLLRNGADVNEKPAPFHGATALQGAAMGGYCNVAVFLLDKRANLFAPPSQFGGRWPIEGAAEFGRLDMIQLLWNASLSGFPIEQCRRAIELAKANGHGGCVDLIRELAVSNGIMPTLEESED